MSQPISNRIYVAGLDGKVSAADLRTYFGKFGEMTDVYIPNNHQTGQPKHFGFVTFGDENMAQEALATRTHEINGQPVELKPCVPKDQMAPKGGGKGDAGALAAAGLLGVPGAAPGLGMTLPLQSALIQPALGGLPQLQPALIQPGLQALQQQALFQQQQQLQQQQLLQMLAKMQQPQQLAQPNFFQFGAVPGIPGVGLPAGLPADAGSSPSLGLGGCAGLPGMGLPADTGTAPAAGLPAMSFPGSENAAVAGGISMQQPFMSNGFPTSGALAFGTPAIDASTAPAAAPAMGAVPAAFPSSGQPEGLQAAGLLPPVDQTAGAGNAALAFGVAPAAEAGQGAARVAPY